MNSNHSTSGKSEFLCKRRKKMDKTEEKEYTKISIHKKLHVLVKSICDKEGLKMYHFEDEAVKDFVRKNFPKYINNGNEKLFDKEK